jgi:hypothetical protein
LVYGCRPRKFLLGGIFYEEFFYNHGHMGRKPSELLLGGIFYEEFFYK